MLEALVASELLLVEGVSRGCNQEPLIKMELDKLQQPLMVKVK